MNGNTMKLHFHLFCLIIISILCLGCNNNDEAKIERDCIVSELKDKDLIKVLDSFNNVIHLVNKFQVLEFDSLFIFKPYTDKDSLFNDLNCYTQVFDKIGYEDEFYLFVLFTSMNYKFLPRNQAVLTENKKYVFDEIFL